MCGIIGLFYIQNEMEMRQEALNMVRKIRHRGPDWSGSYSNENCVLIHYPKGWGNKSAFKNNRAI